MGMHRFLRQWVLSLMHISCLVPALFKSRGAWLIRFIDAAFPTLPTQSSHSPLHPWPSPTAGCSLDAMTTIKLEKNCNIKLEKNNIHYRKGVVKLGHFYIFDSSKNYSPFGNEYDIMFQESEKMFLLWFSKTPSGNLSKGNTQQKQENVRRYSTQHYLYYKIRRHLNT